MFIRDMIQKMKNARDRTQVEAEPFKLIDSLKLLIKIFLITLKCSLACSFAKKRKIKFL
jgi:hypothetical protein